MRFIRVICLLLATAICCNAAAIQEDTKSTNQQAVGTVNNTALAKNSSTPVVPDNASVTTANATTTVATATTVSTNGNGNKDNSTSPANEQSTSTALPTTSSTTTVTAAPTTLSTTIKKTPIPENCTTADTITTTTTATTITTPTTSNASNVLSTAAVPVSTKVAPPSSYKERHFDGLSFLGGIILATCLMAIGVLSWKSYKTFNEQNYRTL
ncbi:hypothetical protein WN51_05074 [Melipona quadrifasciata]|uniref:Sialomucin core protein 24 n=1 Tax=Melipona quadrifasciata TaxID=166423 RepID=A0A0N0BD17_9HYME|nr:hypothetical protein WN51_05074 [Melipona quadrifasciata]